MQSAWPLRAAQWSGVYSVWTLFKEMRERKVRVSNTEKEKERREEMRIQGGDLFFKIKSFDENTNSTSNKNKEDARKKINNS